MAPQTVRTELMLRQRNATASAIMQRLIRRGPSGRAELAEATGVTFTTITKTVTELLELGALTESTPSTPSGVGRPVIPLDVPGPQRLVVGAHLNPKSTSCALYTLRGQRIAWRTVAASGRTQKDRIDEAADLVEEMVIEAGDSVLGIGITTPWAEVHHRQPPPLLADVDHLELRDEVRRRLRQPVRVEPNVRALAVEHFWWSGGGEDVLTILIGRSVGVAQMRGGDLVWDGPGAGGLVSHIVVPGSSHPCECGQVGCVKATCTDDALVRRAIAAKLLPPGAVQHDLYPTPDTEPLRRLRHSRAEELGRVIPLIMSLVDPGETIVRGKVGTPDDISTCIQTTRARYSVLVHREANVSYNDEKRPDYWPRASAALALDRYLASPLEHETDRALRRRVSVDIIVGP